MAHVASLPADELGGARVGGWVETWFGGMLLDRFLYFLRYLSVDL